MSFTYLASPYSPVGGPFTQFEKNQLRNERFHEVCAKAAELMTNGELIFCPIAHSHPIEQHMYDIRDGDFWLNQDFAILKAASKLKVFRMHGWECSNGVRKEIEFAEKHGIPVEYID